ncbi:histidine phosphatase family protein [Sphingomonas adhaesiva]|uniref:histidine phosphatase family protein n=1 Tax=Sphingomonas adhaesiva TaxID=28212 RepID=UPI002FF5F3AC
MSVALYLSHPEVRIDPAVPVPRWGLSAAGRARVEAIRDRAWLRDVERIVSSDEDKAQETARLIGDAIGVAVEVGRDMGENDRSATGFLPPDEFEATADAFFATPDVSVRGWETARDAQTRIVAAIRETLAGQEVRPTLFVGHGGVGTLLACAVRGAPIDRAHDQGRVAGANPRGGNVHGFASDMRDALFGWRPMEEL